MIFKRTKIVATVGPATHSYDKIEALIKAGANGLRLNFSHGTHDERDAQIGWIRQASDKLKKPVAIMQDLQGPKIRLGPLSENVAVKTGDELLLTYEAEHLGNVIPLQYDLARKVAPGQRLSIFDGKVRTTILEVYDNTVKVRVENDGILMSRKGVNVPDTDFGGDILTEKDLADIEYGVQRDFDYVALSFVQRPEDIVNLRRILTQKGSSAKIIAKIETKAAAQDQALEEIIKVSDGVMAARGDLAMEAGAEIVPIVQQKILGFAQAHCKLSIVATQMMASMVDSPEPTRAEVTDVALATMWGADAVMLSEETAMGSFPLETVQAMKKVIVYTQEQAPVQPVFYRENKKGGQQDAISAAAVTLAQQLNVTALVAQTKSGATAASIAAHRPSLPIISVSGDPRVAQQLALLYANKSFLEPDSEKAGLNLVKRLKEEGFFGEGEVQVVIVSGLHPGITGGTDTIRVRNL